MICVLYLVIHGLKKQKDKEKNYSECLKIFEHIFLSFFYELKMDFAGHFKEWKKKKANHMYLSLRLAQMIVNDLLRVKISFDGMKWILSWTHKEREGIIWEVMSTWFHREDIKTSELLTINESYAKFWCTYYGEKKEGEAKKPRDIHLSNPKINTTFSKGSLSWWFSGIKNDIYSFYTGYIIRVFENDMKNNWRFDWIIWDHFNLLVRVCVLNNLDDFYKKLQEKISNSNITKESLLWNSYYLASLLSKKFENHFEFYQLIFSLGAFKKIFMWRLGKLKNKKSS